MSSADEETIRVLKEIGELKFIGNIFTSQEIVDMASSFEGVFPTAIEDEDRYKSIASMGLLMGFMGGWYSFKAGCLPSSEYKSDFEEYIRFLSDNRK